MEISVTANVKMLAQSCFIHFEMNVDGSNNEKLKTSETTWSFQLFLSIEVQTTFLPSIPSDLTVNPLKQPNWIHKAYYTFFPVMVISLSKSKANKPKHKKYNIGCHLILLIKSFTSPFAAVTPIRVCVPWLIDFQSSSVCSPVIFDLHNNNNLVQYRLGQCWCATNTFIRVPP